MTKRMSLIRFAASLASLFAAAAVVITGCENSSDDSDGPSGSSTVQGTVETFEFALLRQSPPPPRNVREFLAALGDLIVPPAHATVANVVVRVVGTDLETETSENGFFILSGVPPGNQQLEFAFAGNLGTYSLNVPDGAVVTLSGIGFKGETITVDSQQVAVPTVSGSAESAGSSVPGM
jgi:hypothetical protein